jgi:hypothetical protein
MHPSGFGVSPPLWSIEDLGSLPGNFTVPLLRPDDPHSLGSPLPDPVVQRFPGGKPSTSPKTDFDGVGANGYAPSDVNIAVGPNDIVQIVNVRWAVFDKSGNLKAGPATLGSIWSALGGICTSNGGDPIVQYDRFADRWLLSQIGSSGGSYAECVAVSQTNNPAGVYYLWSFSYGSTLNDYPKWAVWPTNTNSAYLSTVNEFIFGQFGLGAQLCAYDRTKMLAGNPNPAAICKVISNDYSYLPADLDGSTPPLDGTPAYFMTLESTSSLRTWTLAPNFANSTGTFTQISPDISIAGFSEACGGGTCIPQTGTTQQLDSLGDRPMYRLAFRMFSDHESIVMNHSVAVSGSSGAGVRWYELQSGPPSTTGTFSVYQQGTYAPNSTYRWMGSIAMDQAGDIGVGYSASDSSIHPAIRYTGRVPSDPINTLETETSILEGTGSQTTNLSRWGDYSALRIDPSDDCTFWYTNQYLVTSGTFNWSTHIGSFKFPGCGAPPVPDYSMSANPSSVTIVTGGAQATSTISVTSLNGDTNTVNLSISGCPTNVNCSLDSSSLTPPSNGTASTTFRVSALSSATPGTYQVTINGSDGTHNHSTTVTVVVNAPTPDFSLSTSAQSITIFRGQTGSVTVTATGIGGSSSVSLSASGIPPRSTDSFSPNPVTATGSSTMQITTNRKTPTGSYTVTITGSNGTFSHSTQITVNVQ